MTDYGISFSTFVGDDGVSDLDPLFRLDDTGRVVVEDVWRGWLTERGTLSWAPGVGGGLMAELNAKQTDATLALIQARLEAEALEDDRVASCTVKVTSENRELSVEGNIELSGGESFRFVGNVSNTKAELTDVSLN